MARLPRFLIPGQPLHIIQRGNNHSIMFAADADYEFFKNCLHEAIEKHRCDIHAYVLMTNHFHLLMTAQEGNNISEVMQSVGRRYVQYFNRLYRRTGTLWEGRYKATLIDSEQYLLACYQYIELNPVRAMMVTDPEDYPWSSYRAHVMGKSDFLISDHPLYLALGRTDEERSSAYKSLFESDLNAETISAIRENTNKAWILGGQKFSDKIATLTTRRLHALAKGRPKMKKIQ